MPRVKKLVPLEYSLDIFFSKILSLLCLSLVARSITHLVMITPYMDFWQDENLWKPVVELFDLSWTWYVQSSYMEHFFTQVNYVMGFTFLILLVLILCLPWHLESLLGRKKPVVHKIQSSVSSLGQSSASSAGQPLDSPSVSSSQSGGSFKKKQHLQEMKQRRLTEAPKILKPIRFMLWMTFGLQLFYTLALYYHHSFYFVIWLEQAIIYTLPVLVYLLLPYNAYKKIHWTHVAGWALSAVFIGHGLVALNYYDTPDHYFIMIMSVFQCSQAQAQLFLQVIGICDLLCACLIHLPVHPTISAHLKSMYHSIHYMMTHDASSESAHKPDHVNQYDVLPIQTSTREAHRSTQVESDLPQIYMLNWRQKLWLHIRSTLYKIMNFMSRKQKHIKSIALYYMFLWGLLTAFARVIGHLDHSWYELCRIWIPAFLVRIPHGLLAYMLWKYHRTHTQMEQDDYV